MPATHSLEKPTAGVHVSSSGSAFCHVGECFHLAVQLIRARGLSRAVFIARDYLKIFC